MNSYKITTLNDFVTMRQKDFPYAKGELSSLLHHIGTASKIVNKKINKAGLVDITGRSGSVNIQGEDQQKLDVFADKVFIDALRSSGECCGVATEENQNEIVFTEKFARKGNYIYFPSGIKKYIKYCQEKDKDTGRPYISRYIGSLVSDFHRNLLMGGVFLYPQNENAPKGKLRIVYECNPMAFIAEQSGGSASDGEKRILEIKPESLHQRSPFYVGSKNMVRKIEQFLEI